MLFAGSLAMLCYAALSSLLFQVVLAGPAHRGRAESVTHFLRDEAILKRSGNYTLLDAYQGENFFDGWNFYSQADPTGGLVTFETQKQAEQNGLAYIRSDGIAVMKVDNATHLKSGQPRKSVRISTKKSYGRSLIVLDAYSIPHGCAVWPAFWTTSSAKRWPAGGEIDIIEGVNTQVGNQMTLHTKTGCRLDTNAAFTGQVVGTNCAASANGNAGCGVLNNAPNSFGHGFNTNNGGIYATLILNSGVSIWHFPRGSIPQDLLNDDPNPSGWGTPSAFWASSSCPAGEFIDTSQQIIFDITLCGDWAGNSNVYQQSGCPGSCAAAVANPANFNDAHWHVASVKVYSPP